MYHSNKQQTFLIGNSTPCYSFGYKNSWCVCEAHMENLVGYTSIAHENPLVHIALGVVRHFRGNRKLVNQTFVRTSIYNVMPIQNYNT